MTGQSLGAGIWTVPQIGLEYRSVEWEFSFGADKEASDFCCEIVALLVQEFGVGRDEAVGRINRLWHGLDFVEGDLRYHELPEFWASDIYYGPDSHWWTKPVGLKPLPYP